MTFLIDYGPFLAVFVYIAMFFTIGRLAANDYLQEDPINNLKNIVMDEYDKKDLAKRIVHHSERQEEISFVLCGFAIISLVFIITVFQKNIAEVELIVGFFSLAFVFEIISAFFYHDIRKNLYAYLGTVFQYGGLFSMMLGFFNYLYEIMDWSLIINVVYVFGIISVAILSAREILIYVEYSRNVRENE